MKEVTIVELTTRKEIIFDTQEYLSYTSYKIPMYVGKEGTIPYSKDSEYRRDWITIPIHRFTRCVDGDYPWDKTIYKEDFVSYSPEVWECLQMFKESVESDINIHKVRLINEENKVKSLEAHISKSEWVIVNASLWERIRYVFTRRIA